MNNNQKNEINEITGKDVLFLYLLILITPILAMMLFPYINENISQLLLIYFALVIILTFSTILSRVLKKHYLTVLFGCHHRKERSFICSLKYLGICSRCTGIYVGVFFSFILIILNIPWYVYLIIGIPLIIDGITQHLKYHNSNNLIRVITGIFFGPTLVFMFYLFHYSLYQISYFFYSLF